MTLIECKDSRHCSGECLCKSTEFDTILIQYPSCLSALQTRSPAGYKVNLDLPLWIESWTFALVQIYLSRQFDNRPVSFIVVSLASEMDLYVYLERGISLMQMYAMEMRNLHRHHHPTRWWRNFRDNKTLPSNDIKPEFNLLQTKIKVAKYQINSQPFPASFVLLLLRSKHGSPN